MHLFATRLRLTALGTCLFAVYVVGLAAQQPTVPPHTPAFEAARLNNIGTAFMGQQLLDRAATTFAEAAKADPNLVLAKINEGIALLYLQRFAGAEQILDAAALADPKDPHVWYALGLLYRNQNKPQQSLDAFKKALALRPADPDTHYMVASVDLELEDMPAAAAEFRKAIALNPHHASSIFGLARALHRQGDSAGAKQALLEFQHISSSKLGAPLSHTYGEEGRYGRVEDAVLAPISVGPMIPVTFTESWHSPSSKSSVPGSACLINLSGSDEAALLVLGSGDDAVQLFDRVGTTRFEKLPSAQTGLQIPGTGIACAVGDFDNDGLPDLALAITSPDGKDRILLYRNLGGGKFEDVTASSGITTTNRPTSLTFVDYDHDGDLDLFITGKPLSSVSRPNTLWRNNGNKTFSNWTQEAALGGTTPTTSAILTDLNNDRAVDLVIAGDSPAPTFFSNHREGPFGSTPLFTDTLPPTVSVTTLDFNKDGWMDILLSHSGAPGVTLWRNIDGKSFASVPLPLHGILSATAAIPIDFDNDGWIDIAALVKTAHGSGLRILRNLGPAGFVDVSAQLRLNDLHLRSPRSLIAADINHTGAADLIITQEDGTAVLLTNRGGNRNHVLHISLRGLADNKSGIGTKVEVFANGLWQKWEDNGQPEILAGLGSADKADLVRLLWPTGVPQDEIDVAATDDKPFTELDRRGSSCPTLFAWNGSRYNFISDVIGAAVIGHWVSPTKHNIPDPDEWIKVDGSQLQQRNGLFSLRFGEPMEEVNFVDQVRLVAIDHPSNSSVYPNEGFLSEPPFAKQKTILTSAAHPLAGAWDDHGANVLSILSAPLADQVAASTPIAPSMQSHRMSGETDPPPPAYVRDFHNLPFAGFANLHSLTIDIGPWSPQHPLRLLLHGFIEYFSASSMYSAWQAGLAPIPPYIEAQLPDGTWRKVVTDMGFPAGLPRTVTVDLTGKLPTGVTRLRITTNLQIYWDQALVDNEPDAAQQHVDTIHTTELPLAHATLAFRGYPRQIDGHTPGDLTYNYRNISASGPFVPHRGAYTRYGDVTPLLRSIDDEFVIFGTGEDMDLEFRATTLPALPKGWSRDYFFYANGYVKDMDFYEAKPFSVGALPFHGMSAYPYPANEHYPTDGAHTAYQLEYNTRFESGTTDRSYQFNYAPHLSMPDSQ
jgi:thioredoxin-like negative regulator of GroEL